MNKTIQFKGINLNNSVTNNTDGNCEEVLNLRPKVGKWEAVGRKKEYSDKFRSKSSWMDSLDFDGYKIVKYHQHKVGDKINDIFILHAESENSQTENGIKGIWLKGDTTRTPVVLWELPTDNNNRFASVDNSLGIDIESIGNFLSFNLPEVTTFLFQDGEYQKTKQTEISAPPINFNLQSRFSPIGQKIEINRLKDYGAQIGGWSYWKDSVATDVDPESPTFDEKAAIGVVLNTYKYAPDDAFNVQDCLLSHSGGENMPIQFCNIQFTSDVNTQAQEAFGGSYKLLQEDTEDYREGFVFVCSAYQLFDGTYTNISAPVMMHLGTQGFNENSSQESYDTFYCRDKVQIDNYWLNGYPSYTEKFGFNITGHVRRQRQQRIIFERPTDIPTDLGKEYSKIVYFVSKPISMYDFSVLDVHHLHIHRLMPYSGIHSVGRWGYGTYTPKAGDPRVRFSLSNPMSTIESVGTLIGHKYTNDSLREGLPVHLPTKEELENLTFYKAVEFDYKDDSDIGETYADATSSFVGKAVNFNNLIEDEVLSADTSSNEKYFAKGLMTYNRRLHLYGVTSIFKDKMPTTSDNAVTVEFDNVFFVDVTQIAGKNMLYKANYETRTFTSEDNLYRYTDYIKYNVEIDGTMYSYVEDLTDVISPVLPFMDSRMKTAEIYWTSLNKYYKTSISAIESKVYNMSVIDIWKFKLLRYENVNRNLSRVEITADEYNAIVASANTWTTDNNYAQPTRLKVSNQSNPIIFPPELDFDFDDDIVALGNNYKEISLAQEGQYPTYVFTKKGIWAMGVGSSAFYASQIPVHPDIAVSRSTLGIGSGVIFIAKDGVKLLNGREVVSISEPLRGVASGISQINSVKSAIGVGQNPNRLNAINYIYNDMVDEYLEELLFSKHAIVGFDRMNNEIIVCHTKNGDYQGTSYAFNLDSKMWYKRSEKFYSFYRDYGCRKELDCPIINFNNVAGVTNFEFPNTVVWLCEETDRYVPREQASNVIANTQVVLLTRPLSLGNLGFKQLYHEAIRGEMKQNDLPLGTMGDIDISPNNPHLGFYVIASNDGGNWKMVGGKVWQTSVTQVVLERLKQSYRYIAFMIAGYVNEKFNITHIDLDGIDKLNTRQR